ncbi:MAG: VCBS repeat-containing protein [Planctomycetales bacterium]|nr:VCBS repeat-containing protein [Planctomycetales bacterium]
MRFGVRQKNVLVERLESRRLLTASFIFEPHQIDLTSRGSFGQARSAYSADLDGDGDVDVVSVSKTEATVAWHENVDGKGTFRPQPRLISTQATNADFVIAADVDSDGDIDVVYASAKENTIAWFENGGGGSFGDAKLISADSQSPRSIQAANLDGDQNLDLLVASHGDNTIAWFEYEDSLRTFGSRHVISNEVRGASSVSAADVDADGDTDVLVVSFTDGEIRWFENQTGSGDFAEGKVVLPANPNSKSYFATTADFDGDGVLDVVSASWGDGAVSWQRQVAGEFASPEVIMSNLSRRVLTPRIDSVATADLDGDGDLDVIAADEFGHHTYWSENLGPMNGFGPQLPVGPSSEMTGGSVEMVDLDGDGDLDILAASDHEGIIAWHENRLIGDSNNDGVFNNVDLIVVFTAGEYFDDIPGNSTFEEGDWNLDGDFNSSDLILAFQARTYNVAASHTATKYAAAVDSLFERDELQSRHSARRAS